MKQQSPFVKKFNLFWILPEEEFKETKNKVNNNENSFAKESYLNQKRYRRIKDNKIGIAFLEDNNSSSKFITLKVSPTFVRGNFPGMKEKAVERVISLNYNLKELLDKQLNYSDRDIAHIFANEGYVKFFNRRKKTTLTNNRLKALKEKTNSELEDSFFKSTLEQRLNEKRINTLNKRKSVFSKAKNIPLLEPSKGNYILDYFNKDTFNLINNVFNANDALRNRSTTYKKQEDFFITSIVLSFIKKAGASYDFYKNKEKKKTHDLLDAEEIFKKGTVALLKKDYIEKRQLFEKKGLLSTSKRPFFYKGPFSIKKESS